MKNHYDVPNFASYKTCAMKSMNVVRIIGETKMLIVDEKQKFKV